MSYNIKSGIKAWAEDDRPREKLLNKGKQSLSDAELIAILIGMGTREMSAVELAKLILQSTGNNLNELAKLGVKELMKFKGIGEAKAISIVAAMELARRRKDTDPLKKDRIRYSKEAYNILKPYMMDLDHEQFWMVCLNRNQEVVKIIQISTGGVTGTIADPKIIFKHAVEQLSSCIILSHNHPSGNLNPSEADIKLTKQLCEGARLLDMTLSDHIIFSNDGYFSFADQNML
ncbi:RadC family protein [Lacihabitans soyangensis]|uniref:DNA repair protein RadC n=1 Tax=Lacihabitans soyangensis TaxID=869394 RepID=A0AAE3H5G1_9BACT|nr:DNA repair protein RadC [Lacihabitans soyangensis]MCP9764525.1 DNA repair protein RadC [Lacihabitans soyangensis]